jgi:hypothetical protein
MRKGKRERGIGERKRNRKEEKEEGKEKMVYQIYDTPFLRITYYVELICVD